MDKERVPYAYVVPKIPKNTMETSLCEEHITPLSH